MIVSVHIPKTAGTSFGGALEQHFTGRLLYDYGDRPMARSPEDESRRRASAAAVDPAALLPRYDAVHGHFLASKYAALGTAARLATFFRDPVARTISHYRHWQRYPDLPNPMAGEVGSGRLTPAGFAARPEIARTYPIFLDGVPVEAFAFIGLTEAYDESLKLFEAVFGIALPVSHENTNGDSETDADEWDIAAIQAAQAENTVLYDQARRRFDTLCRAYL